ncbi:ATP-grasp domain-containing protein [Gemmata obscuriglobus]|uniref:ATP-grasp domain-containing protein n=1 Tax=Gemmata obscuriglobus TaxID=114 RepID=UPI0008FB57DC|nr:ATP-grasp domain-containing protein [Gemmata obscuriglobus]
MVRSCPDAPVLLSEPVEWSVELRYFVLEGRVIAGSPYLSYGRPAWRRTDASGPLPTAGRPLVEQLCADMKDRLPPVFVADVGLIEDRGWAVVEFNPVWSAGLLNADPGAVLPALQRASRRRTELTDDDRRWDLPK